MGKPITEAVEGALEHLVGDFQNKANANKFWNERDTHWSLFYYLKQANVSGEAYPTQLIRAEFPTLIVFPGTRSARGHYDLVILNADSWKRPEIQNMKSQAEWNDYLKLIKIDVAIEIKLWLNRLKPDSMEERVNWDIQKLTQKPNNVSSAYFLNFVQLDFESKYYQAYYQQLYEYLYREKQPGLNILCVPSDPQFQPASKNWL